MKTVLLNGKTKVGIIEENTHKILVVALEDAIITDSFQTLQLMKVGHLYAFCRCCFEKRVKKEAS